MKKIPIPLVDSILNLLDAFSTEYEDFAEYVESWLQEKQEEGE